MIKILHISDIHFGIIPAKAGGNPKQAHAFLSRADPNKSDPLVLARLLAQACRTPDIVICSGDIGWSGASADYSEALAFFRELRAIWPLCRLSIVPGNHDVDLSHGLHERRQDNFFGLLVDLFGGDLLTEYPLLTSPELASRRLDSRERLAFVARKPGEWLLVGLNSAASINDLRDQIHVDGDVLVELGKQLPSLDSFGKRELRVAIFHHHLLPFVETPYWSGSYAPGIGVPLDTSIIANSGSVQNWLRANHFDVVLHGHKHQFHARSDTLWVGGDERSRTQIIIGAGSASVMADKLPSAGTTHTFNVIDVLKPSRSNSIARVSKFDVHHGAMLPAAKLSQQRVMVAGDEHQEGMGRIHGDSVADCHRLVEFRCSDSAAVTHFQSTVEVISEDDFDQIDSSWIGSRQAKKADFELCFAALYPHWAKHRAWPTEGIAAQPLRDELTIRHEERLFRQIQPSDSGGPTSPIAIALAQSRTRRYVSLFDAELEVSRQFSVVPGLVGLQFTERELGGEQKKLDLVMTFRNLELSFWWVVNHLEAIRLLSWACQAIAKYHPQLHVTPGRVQVYSPFAQWLSDDPKPPMAVDLELMEQGRLVALAIAASHPSGVKGREALDKLVEDYGAKLNRNNVHVRGLEQLRQAFAAIRDAGGMNERSDLCLPDLQLLDKAVSALREALARPHNPEDDLKKARAFLASAFEEWSGTA